MCYKEYCLSFVLGLFLGFGFWLYLFENRMQPEPTFISDTVVVTKMQTLRDTITSCYPVAKRVITHDTVWKKDIPDSTYLLVEQKQYSDDSTYTAWVSGISPVLDSISVIRLTNEIVRTEKVTNTVYVKDNKWSFFTGVGVSKFQSDYIPRINVFVTTGKFGLGTSVGLYDNKPLYGVDINYKLK